MTQDGNNEQSKDGIGMGIEIRLSFMHRLVIGEELTR